MSNMKKNAKIVRIISLICMGLIPIWFIVSWFFIGKFWVTGMPVLLFLAGAFIIFDQAFLKMSIQAGKEEEQGFLHRGEQSRQNDAKSQRNRTKEAKPALQESFPANLSLLQEGNLFAKEIDKANDLIPDESVTKNLNEICGYVKDIFSLASKNESIEHQIRKFSNIYLPQALKLCNLYIDLDSKRMQTKDVENLKDQIANSIDNAKCAFSNFNDNLIRQSSIDIEAEIKTFNDVLAIDGLLNRQEMVMPKQTKKKEKA
ncbi:MAG: 5-bromo-4-chloroindolyl phosphate hydrolysis family protein [Anaerofustis sp.]